jgi:hypothetical protein
VFLGSGSTGTVALKVFHPHVAPDDIGRELDALSRLDSPHLVRLLDLSSGRDDVPILVLERVARGSLVTLLRDRDSLERGEVVTVLAPMAAVLAELHRNGVGHERMAAATVHLGSAGEPVLLGFGHCSLFAAGGSIAAIESEPAAAQDRGSLAALAATLLTRVRDAATDRRTVGLIEWIESAPREFEFPEQLEARLFDFADPLAIEIGREAEPRSGVPARIRFADRAAPITATPLPTPKIEVADSRADGLLGMVGAYLLDNPIDVLRARVLAAAKSVRKPFWFAAGGVVLALVVVIAALPQSPARPPVAVVSPMPSRRAEPSITPSALPADPVAALPILLADRTACIRAMSVLCLTDVDEASSSAYSGDAALIEQLQGGTETPKTAIVTAPAPTLIELLGDSALVSLGPVGNPASVLMIKDEAGWRIRGYLSGVQSTGAPQSGGSVNG